MPKIIYGTAWKKERTHDFVEKALNSGFRGIDTACQPKHYHEPGVGSAIGQALKKGLKRESLFIQTKFTSLDGQDPKRIPYDSSKPLASQVAESCAVSLQNLGVDYIDSYVLHGPLPREGEMIEVWRAMELLFQQGKVKQIGISNCYQLPLLEWLWELADIKPSVLQNRFYVESGYDRELRTFCTDRDIIYQSFWTLTANPHLLESESFSEIASQIERTPAQVLFRYLIQHGCSPLTGTTSEKHMRDDLEVFAFTLKEEQISKIDQVLDYYIEIQS